MVSRGPLLLGSLWLTAAVTATSVGLLAVQLVGNEVGGQVAAPLDDAGVHQALVSVSPTPSHPEESEAEHPAEQPSDQQPAQGRARTVTTEAGVLSARCADSRPQLLYATPADGFRTERGTQSVAFVGTSRRVVLTLTCSGEELRTTSSTEQIGTRTPSPSPTPSPTVQPSPTRAPEPSDQPDRPDTHSERDSQPHESR